MRLGTEAHGLRSGVEKRASEVREKRTTTRRTTKGRRPRRTPHNKEQRGACARRAPRRMRKSERERDRASEWAGRRGRAWLSHLRKRRGRQACAEVERGPRPSEVRRACTPRRILPNPSDPGPRPSLLLGLARGVLLRGRVSWERCRGQVSTENWADIEKSEDRSADRLDVRKEGQGWLHSVHGGVTTHWDRETGQWMHQLSQGTLVGLLANTCEITGPARANFIILVPSYSS